MPSTSTNAPSTGDTVPSSDRGANGPTVDSACPGVLSADQFTELHRLIREARAAACHQAVHPSSNAAINADDFADAALVAYLAELRYGPRGGAR